MKKILVLAGLMTSLVACSSCSKKTQVEPQNPEVVSCDGGSCPWPLKDSGVEDAAPVTDVVAQENWQFTLPGPGWIPHQDPNPAVKVSFSNEEKKCRITFVKEATKSTYSEYTVENLRALSGSGAKIDSAVVTDVNGNKFVLIQATQTTNTIWAWTTNKTGFGYVFACGGPTDANLRELCTSIGNTVQIN